MSVIRAAKCEIEIQEQTDLDKDLAAAKYMVILSYEPEGLESKEIISIVLTNTLPYINQTNEKR